MKNNYNPFVGTSHLKRIVGNKLFCIFKKVFDFCGVPDAGKFLNQNFEWANIESSSFKVYKARIKSGLDVQVFSQNIEEDVDDLVWSIDSTGTLMLISNNGKLTPDKTHVLVSSGTQNSDIYLINSFESGGVITVQSRVLRLGSIPSIVSVSGGAGGDVTILDYSLAYEWADVEDFFIEIKVYE